MYILFDIGGTKTRVAASRDGQSFCESLKCDTPPDFEDGVAKFVALARQLAGDEQIVAVAAGVAGPMDRTKSMVVAAPNLPGYNHQPLRERIAQELSCDVYLENDSAIVALGEAHAGAGRGHDIVAYITISTGVGGARIVGGQIDANVFGFEPGHQIIDIDHTLCPNCDSGEPEYMISGTSVEHRLNMKPYEVEDPRLWEQLSMWTAVMLNNTIVHWSPHVVVLGGSMIVGDPAIPVERIAYHLDKIMTIFPEKPEIRPAELKSIGGLHGALAYVKQRVMQDRTQ